MINQQVVEQALASDQWASRIVDVEKVGESARYVYRGAGQALSAYYRAVNAGDAVRVHLVSIDRARPGEYEVLAQWVAVLDGVAR